MGKYRGVCAALLPSSSRQFPLKMNDRIRLARLEAVLNIIRNGHVELEEGPGLSYSFFPLVALHWWTRWHGRTGGRGKLSATGLSCCPATPTQDTY